MTVFLDRWRPSWTNNSTRIQHFERQLLDWATVSRILKNHDQAKISWTSADSFCDIVELSDRSSGLTGHPRCFAMISSALSKDDQQRDKWYHAFTPHHPSRSPLLLPQANWPQGWQAGGQLALCVIVCERQSQQIVSVTPRAKRKSGWAV